MRRFEIRCMLGLTLVSLWTLQFVYLFKYSRLNQELMSQNEALSSDINKFKLELDTKIEASNEASEKLRREVTSNDINLMPQTSQYLPLTKSRKLNIFVESFKLTNASDANYRQFYKNFGKTGNEDLFAQVTQLPEHRRKRILVTGGAGFVGSHLVDSLMLDGHEVIVADNFYTGRRLNCDHWIGHPSFEMLNHDIVNPLTIEVNEIYHLASPASPVHYMANPIKTIKTNTIGTINLLGLAKRNGAKILIASTSEIYGDPKVHPQSELYWGHVNPIGPRSCYDESKRLSEALAVAYHSKENVSIRIARIFNTYGPRMHPNDGRVVSNFIIQALRNSSMSIYGTGSQTRSFQFITDLVSGLKMLMESHVTSPVNFGNDDEMTVFSLARQIKRMLPNSTSYITFSELPIDDPHRRRPDIQRARKQLDWSPKISLTSGLKRTIEYFKQELNL